jgi:hypothetical protein
MPSTEAIYLIVVAAGPIALGLALVRVLLRVAGKGWHRDAQAEDCAGPLGLSERCVEQPDVTRRRETAVALAVGFALCVVGGLAGWAYLATLATVHGS